MFGFGLAIQQYGALRVCKHMFTDHKALIRLCRHNVLRSLRLGALVSDVAPGPKTVLQIDGFPRPLR